MNTLEYDLSGLEQVVKNIESLQERLAEAIPGQLRYIRDVWVQAVSGEQLPGMERPVNNPYYREVLEREDAVEWPVEGDRFWGRVVAEDEVAARVEHGRGRRDMKLSLLNGPHSRVGKRGQRYNIIPLGFSAPKPGVFSPSRTGGLMVGTSPFRVVSSDKSPPWSWIYPAVPDVAVIDAVMDQLEPVVTEALRRVVQEWRA